MADGPKDIPKTLKALCVEQDCQEVWQISLLLQGVTGHTIEAQLSAQKELAHIGKKIKCRCPPSPQPPNWQAKWRKVGVGGMLN